MPDKMHRAMGTKLRGLARRQYNHLIQARGFERWVLATTRGSTVAFAQKQALAGQAFGKG